jgi:hypothetical protein
MAVRITTRVCLDVLRRSARVPRSDRSPICRGCSRIRTIAGQARRATSPDTLAIERETIELAFLVTLQSARAPARS